MGQAWNVFERSIREARKGACIAPSWDRRGIDWLAPVRCDRERLPPGGSPQPADGMIARRRGRALRHVALLVTLVTFTRHGLVLPPEPLEPRHHES